MSNTSARGGGRGGAVVAKRPRWQRVRWTSKHTGIYWSAEARTRLSWPTAFGGAVVDDATDAVPYNRYRQAMHALRRHSCTRP